MIALALNVAVVSFTVTIAGAHGRLGRELVSQCLQRGWSVNGVVRRPEDPVFAPIRKGWLSPNEKEDSQRIPILSSNLTLTTNTTCKSNTNGIVFVMSARPFSTKLEMSVQNEVVRRLCGTARSTNCSKICLVSAFGSGDSLEGSNVGYKIMHDFYLKEGYAAKEEQERIVSKTPDMDTLILRPKVLSFEKIPMNNFAVVRSELAEQILDWLEV
ncbi:MAG: hypothetical protein CBC12_05315 [Candidatus Puniceispirillum sp. TMED52]|jgi:hypothetical protein|nr:MAG: hypothetical protein CBC12_05315 [Candidatus Puniceispirillum sp. TMED52]RPF82247.1 MAG: hypothetical protein CBC65_000710 [Rhodothermaceae bacterium TMED105]|tara:strand:- start:3988 stop:4629 length:642 start_codon:yes stop_codon:yes gene_type:complete